jgi:hypothetical protein
MLDSVTELSDDGDGDDEGDAARATGATQAVLVKCRQLKKPVGSYNEASVFPYASTTFLSAVLLFLVQPLIAKQILPWFGGSAAVWTTCMLFFQTALLADDYHNLVRILK